MGGGQSDRQGAGRTWGGEVSGPSAKDSLQGRVGERGTLPLHKKDPFLWDVKEDSGSIRNGKEEVFLGPGDGEAGRGWAARLLRHQGQSFDQQPSSCRLPGEHRERFRGPGFRSTGRIPPPHISTLDQEVFNKYLNSIKSPQPQASLEHLEALAVQSLHSFVHSADVY